MKKEEAIKILKESNRWRRGLEKEMPDPKQFGLAIDFAVKYMNNVETDVEVESVKIECPNCGEICDAEVMHTDYEPFADYTHLCEHCSYWITESEWEEIK